MVKKVIKSEVHNHQKAPIIEGLSKSEIRIWVAFCKSIRINLNK